MTGYLWEEPLLVRETRYRYWYGSKDETGMRQDSDAKGLPRGLGTFLDGLQRFAITKACSKEVWAGRKAQGVRLEKNSSELPLCDRWRGRRASRVSLIAKGWKSNSQTYEAVSQSDIPQL